MDGELRRVSRRAVLAAAGGAVASALAANGASADQTPALKGRIKQSVCRWCYSRMSLDDLCANAKSMGLTAIDLLSENDWPVVAKYGLICSMANGPGGIADGWNTVANHDRLVREAERLLPLVKQAGCPNMIIFSGNRRGISDAEGLANCEKGIRRIIKLAEDLNVTLCMELLNSKRDHHDYQCDHSAWGVELCKRIGSNHMKLLYDIYHMQIMEGDLCDTIQQNIQYIAHFHTGGVPGRNEIDQTQEVNYRRVMQTIAGTGFQGFVAHEFIPKRDPMASLKEAIAICDV